MGSSSANFGSWNHFFENGLSSSVESYVGRPQKKIIRFIPLELGGTNMMLGIQRPRAVGWIHIHFRAFIMKFLFNKEVQTLYG